MLGTPVVSNIPYGLDYCVFGLCPSLSIFFKHNFSKIGSVSVFWCEVEEYLFCWVRSNGTSKVGAPPPRPTPEDGNIQFPKCCFKKYWTMDEVQKLNNPNSITPLSEPYRIKYLLT